MSELLSDRVKQLKPSATIAVSMRAAALRAEGKDIINLSVGEPDFDTPDFIKQAAIQAIQDGHTKYTAVDGIAPLKQAIIAKLKKDNQLDYAADQIIVSTGVKQGLYNLCQVLLNPGDEAIIPAPYWVSYPAMVELAGGKPVIIHADMSQNFKITAKQLAAAITPKTRLLFINSPSNPSGKAYTKAELTALGEVIKQHPHIVVASDDMYEYIYWADEAFSNIVNACPELKDRTIVFNGVSKAHAMTGWRIGYAAGPKTIISTMKKIQSQSTSNPNSIAQHAAVAALKGDREVLAPMMTAYKERHDYVLKTLQAIDGVECLSSDGTFYLFPNVTAAIQRHGLKDDIALAELILNEAHVAMVPGTAFGMPGHIRLSCAVSMETLETALARLEPILKG